MVASGANRVNEEKISGMVSEPIKMAHADFVRKKTGFAIPVREWLLEKEAVTKNERGLRAWAKKVYKANVGD